MKRGIISFVLVVAFLIPFYDSAGLVAKAAKRTSDAKAQILWLENRYYSELEIKDSLKSVLANAGQGCLGAAACQRQVADALAQWESEMEKRAADEGADADAWFGSLAEGDAEKIRAAAFENGPGKDHGLRHDFGDNSLMLITPYGCLPPFPPYALKSTLFAYPDGLGNILVSRSGAEVLKSEYDRCSDGSAQMYEEIEKAKAFVDLQLVPYAANGTTPYFGVTVADRESPRKYAYVVLVKEGYSARSG